MRVFFDTEFIEDGRTIDLISIGMVREDGSKLYLQNADCNLDAASPWVAANVIPHLSNQWAPRSAIASMVQDFAGSGPEFWAYYAAYDWVALCQLYGTMMDRPNGWPAFCRDLRQIMSEDGPPIPEADTHHALADAEWAHAAWLALRGT